MPETPQGWYPDPHQPAQQRWWDGVQWTTHTAPLGQAPAAAVAATPTEAKSSRMKVIIIVGAVILAVTLLTRSFGVIVMFAGLFLFFIAIYALVRGSAQLFRVRSRGAAWAALGIAFVLMFIGTGANAALGGPGSNTTGSEQASTEAKPFVSTPTEKPTPSPKPTTYEEVDVTTVVPFERTTVDDPQLDVGKTAVTTGADGTKVTTYRVTYVDGVEVARESVSEAVTVAPVNEVTSNGTRPPAPAPVPLVQPANDCHSSYAGVCVPIASDVDCEGGSGNGPAYARGPLQVVGPDVYDLDRDGDGIACD
ncbi:G5 domain-containing protein [Microbacterium sp. ISL-59]|uniref:G5 domain-containing protein n=1 Tax=Microbacterium sp. ISL-59 TaxID=2819159 RepID=UPI002034B4FC|nr:G5 domain-containing protein [Microbacterium sp. ISL-59]